MASWYTEGTVTVVKGNTVVNGAGTKFSNCRSGDMFVGPDNAIYQVINAPNDALISISPAYRGANASGVLYGIVPVNGYPKALADAVNQVILQWGDKLSALGSTGNYDILPPSKGGTGRTDPLGTASNATLTVGTSDITAGRVLKVGDYGFGVIPVFNDFGLDVLTSFGYCYINTGYSTPTGHRNGWLFTLPISPNYVIQEFRSEADGSLHTRAKLSGTWQAWRMTYNTGNTTRAADGTLKAI